MRKIIQALLVISTCGLASCANTLVPAPVPIYVHTCPAAPIYTPAFEKSAGLQLAGLPAGSPLVRMIEDYLSVRAEILECNR